MLRGKVYSTTNHRTEDNLVRWGAVSSTSKTPEHVQPYTFTLMPYTYTSVFWHTCFHKVFPSEFVLSALIYCP